jgi:hypothetical protein
MKENEGPFLHEEEYCDSVGRTGQVRLYDGAPEAEVYILDIYGQAVEAVNQLNETLENGGSVTREDAATVFGRIWSLALLSLGHADIDSDGLEVHHILSISSFGHPTSLKNKQLMIKLVHVLSHAASMIGHLGNIALENSFRVTLCFRWRSIEPFWDDSDEVIARSSEYSIARFHARMDELEAFKVEHRHVYVSTDSSLYQFLNRTKKKYQEDGLTGEQIARLKVVGILDGDKWLHPRNEFHARMDELEAFKVEHEHVRVPRIVPSDKGMTESSLYKFLKRTKTMFQEGKLTGEQIARLKDVGILDGDEWLYPRSYLVPPPAPPHYPTNNLPAGTPPQQYHYHQPPAMGDSVALRNAYTLAQKPKKTPDGLYQRPAGRKRKGMQWDAVRGIWVPE